MTDPPSERRRVSRRFSIPPKLFGRVRTSTAALILAFVLTALLFDHVRIEPEVVVQVPAVQTTSPSSSYVPTRAPQSRSTTPSASETEVQTPESSTVVQSPTTTALPQTILPGIVIPPQIASLIPTPAPTPTPISTPQITGAR